MAKMAILGGGITALSLGWYLREKGRDIAIYEQSDRVGGCIQTEEREGFILEKGPRSLRTRGAGIETLKLVEALGLQDQVIGSNTLSRYLYIDQKMQKVPENPLSFLFSPLTRKHLLTFLKEGFKPKGDKEDETIYEFATRRYNKAIAETFFDPLVSGIYAGDMEQLSMRACFPSLYQLEPLLKGMLLARKPKAALSPFVQRMQKFPLFSFQNGLSTLPCELGKRLAPYIHLNKQVVAVDGTTVTFVDKTQIEADHVYCTIPLNSLPQPPRASLTAVHLGYHDKQLPYKAFGYLIPRSEKERILGVVFDSSVFPTLYPGKLCLTVMMKETNITSALEAVERHLGLKQTPDLIVCTPHPHSIPQYPVGYQKAIQAHQSERLTLVGSAYSGVSVNDCVANASVIASR